MAELLEAVDKKQSILIVDKDLERIEFAIDVLQNEGYKVETASNMRGALSAVNRTPANLILCGLELEDITGEQFLSYLKNDPLRESIPFVYYLSLENQNQVVPKRIIEMGAEDLIFFPLDESVLASRIQNILAAHQDDAKDGIASENRKEKISRGNQPKPESEATNKNRRIEKRSEKRKLLPVPVAVEVSPNGKHWEPGVVVNTSKSGAMIETTLKRRYGQKILIRDPRNENRHIVSGSVAHVLLRENSDRRGIGILFYNATQWVALCNHLLARCDEQNVGPISSEIFPIHVEVSRDGHVWIDAQIVGCNATSAHIKTNILGKPKDALRISFEHHEIPNTVIGRIKQVGLGDEELIANVELEFDKKSGWFEVFAYFAALTDPVMIAKKRAEAIQSKSERKRMKDGSEEGLIDQKWSKNIQVAKAIEPASESFNQNSDQSKSPSTDQRFYQSLVGRKMGDFEVVSFISSGAMGGVFKGWDTALERDVALKVISWELSTQDRFVKMFFKEARLVSKLNHPNVAQIYQIGNVDGVIYYAMEYVQGENLLRLVQSKICLQTAQAVKYLKTACQALDYVSKNKIIHRDIKPANIMLTSNDELKLVDFGVANVDDHSGTKIVGSPLYMSPEIILNKKVDHRSDIYALGATFYQLIAGTPPFVDISLRKIMQKHLNDPIPPLKQKAPNVSTDLCHIIEKMMSKEIDDRFQKYREIIENLDKVVCEDPTSGSQANTKGSIRKAARRIFNR